MASIGAWGAGWKLSVHAGLTVLPSGSIRAFRPDGSTVAFEPAGTTPETWTGSATQDKLVAVLDVSGQRTGYGYTASVDDSTETYNATGKLQSIRQRNGWLTTFSYNSSSQLTSVRNPFGREVQFSYDTQGRLVELLPPGAVSSAASGSATSPIRYAYAEAASLGLGVPAQNQLTSVTWQDGNTRRYHYEDNRFPGALTGITDEVGVRYATYSYNALGRVSRTNHVGGADRADFVYGLNASGQPITYVTDYSGTNGSATTRTYTFEGPQGVLRPVSVTAPCPLCGNTQASTTYEAAGNPTKAVGHDGKVNFYAYDAQGRETERALFPSSYSSATTRPALSAATTVTTTQWHPTWKLPTQIAEPGKLSSYAYDAQGNLTGQSWTATTDATGAQGFAATASGSTYATGWGYGGNGLPASVVEQTGTTETGRWTLTYNALGDVTSVRDVTRDVTATMSSYDATGRMLSGTTDAGVAIGFTYAPRGFYASKTVNSQTINFTQNAIGLTEQVRTPDNQILDYVYDATQRLTDIKLNGAFITQAMLASADYPDTYAKGKLAQLKVYAREAVEALMAAANAQAGAATGSRFPIRVMPGQSMPGQPQFDPRTDMMTMAPMTVVDQAHRTLMEQMARACQCDPNGGYSTPKLTAGSYAHMLWGGHLSPVFSDQSYFTIPVNQSLVDEVVSKSQPATPPGAAVQVYIVADMGRIVGYGRTSAGTFASANGIRLVVHNNNCDRLLRVRNEVITMYPTN